MISYYIEMRFLGETLQIPKKALSYGRVLVTVAFFQIIFNQNEC